MRIRDLAILTLMLLSASCSRPQIISQTVVDSKLIEIIESRKWYDVVISCFGTDKIKTTYRFDKRNGNFICKEVDQGYPIGIFSTKKIPEEEKEMAQGYLNN